LEVLSIASEVNKEQMSHLDDFDSVLSEIKDQHNDMDSLADQFGKMTLAGNINDDELMKELDKMTAEFQQQPD
jgi:hypothetical protein